MIWKKVQKRGRANIGPHGIVKILEALVSHNVPLLHLYVKVGPDMDDTWKTYDGEEIQDMFDRLFSSNSIDHLESFTLPIFSSSMTLNQVWDSFW